MAAAPEPLHGVAMARGTTLFRFADLTFL